MSRRILVATPLYPPESGGPATYAKMLVDEFPREGVEIELVPFSKVRRYPKGIRHIVYLVLLMLRSRHVERMYALDPISVGVPAAIAAYVLRKPLFVRIAGDYAWEQGRQRFGVSDDLDMFVRCHRYAWQVQLLKGIQTFVAGCAHRIVVPSRYLQRIVHAWGIPEEKIQVIYNAPPRFPDVRALARPASAPQRYIVTVARLVPWKGVDALIRAFACVPDPGLSLVIVGDGRERAMLEARAQELHCTDRVRFVGAVPRSEANAYLAHAEAFVLNTGYEGFSHTILEAFALRVPVITTPVGGNPEQVEDRVTGLLVSYNDVERIAAAITELKHDGGLRAKIIGGAVDCLSTFTRERAVRESLNALML